MNTLQIILFVAILAVWPTIYVYLVIVDLRKTKKYGKAAPYIPARDPYEDRPQPELSPFIWACLLVLFILYVIYTLLFC